MFTKYRSENRTRVEASTLKIRELRRHDYESKDQKPSNGLPIRGEPINGLPEVQKNVADTRFSCKRMHVFLDYEMLGAMVVHFDAMLVENTNASSGVQFLRICLQSNVFLILRNCRDPQWPK